MGSKGGEKIRHYKVFFASPSDLKKERQLFGEEVQKFNYNNATPRGFQFDPIGWEKSFRGPGRPQDRINKLIHDSKYCIVSFWRKWGSPPDADTSEYSSGTEEEYNVALECYENGSLCDLIVMFKTDIDPRDMSHPDEQLAKVIKFREKCEKENNPFYEQYGDTDTFRDLIQKYLSYWLLKLDKGEDQQIDHPPRRLWDKEASKVGDPEKAKFEIPDVSSLNEAWNLADKGLVTEAEIAFIKEAIGKDKPEAIIEFGRFLLRMGRVDQAEIMFIKGIEIAQQQNIPVTESVGHASLGHIYQLKGDYRNAETELRESLKISQKLNQLTNIAASLLDLAGILLDQGYVDKTESMIKESLQIYQDINNIEGQATAFGNLGILYSKKAESDLSKKMLVQAIRLNIKLDQPEKLAQNYCTLGNVLRMEGDPVGAANKFKKSLEIQKKLQNLEGIAILQINLGQVYVDCADQDPRLLSTAIQLFNDSLIKSKMMHHQEAMAGALSNIGIVQGLLGDFDAAGKNLDEALVIYTQINLQEAVADTYVSLGRLAAEQKDWNKAEKLLKNSLAIYKAVSSPDGPVTAYTNLGTVYKYRGDLDHARQMYEKALDIAKKFDFPKLIDEIHILIDKLKETKN